MSEEQYNELLKAYTKEVLASMIKAVPSRTIWRRPLMVRQPYSVAVPSTE